MLATTITCVALVIAVAVYIRRSHDEPIRLNRDFNTSLRHEVLLPVNGMAFVTYGQSNSECCGSLGYTVQHPKQVLQFYNHTAYTLAEPGMLGCTCSGASVWPRLGDMILTRNKSVPAVVFASAGVAGSSIEQLLPHATVFASRSQPYEYLVATVRALQEHTTVDGILYHQGESNCGNSYDVYYGHLVTLGRAVAADTGVPLYISTATRCGGEYRLCSQVAHAQTAFALAGRPQVRPGPNTDVLLDNFRFDTCHLNRRGLNATAGLWYAALAPYL